MHYNCVTFSHHDITLLSDHTVSVNSGQAHGHWEEEPDGIGRVVITWHWAGDTTRAKRHEYRLLQPGLWAHTSDDMRYNGILAALPN